MDCRQSLLVAFGLAWGTCGCVTTEKRPTPPPTPDNVPEHAVKREPTGPKRNPRPETLVEIGTGSLKDAARPDQSPAEQSKLYEQASKAFNQALQINPECLPALVGLCHLYTQSDDYDRAMDAYRKALEKAPRDASLWMDLGMCMIRKKDFESAVRYLQKVTELEPDNRRVLPALGFCLALTGRRDESVACLARVYGPAQAHVKVARVLLRIDREDMARQHLQMALQTNPNLPDARAMLAQLEAGTSLPGQDGGEAFVPVSE
jgi:tetratricopeptide (TPR) repeat protein